LSFDAGTQAIKDKRYDDARRFANDVIETDQTVHLFTDIARASLDNKDQVRATELLNEAATKAASATDSQEKLRGQLEIANIFAGFDAIRGFEVIGQAVQTVNKVRDYDPNTANNFVRTLGGKSRNTMTMVSNNQGADISNTLAILARQDFDRALLLAQS